MSRLAPIAIALALLPAPPAVAATPLHGASKAMTAQHFSAARRLRRQAHTAPAPAPAPPASRWNGPDPTKGPGIDELHRLQRQGQCVVDEGYGRYTACGVY